MLSLSSITKSYPGVRALDNVQLNVRPGTIHGLIGENGAGKSTLMKILAGTTRADSGEIRLNEKKVSIGSVHEAHSLGIFIVYQELSLFNNITAAQNIFAMREPCKAFGIIDDKKIISESRKILAHYDIPINPTSPVHQLSLAHRQLLEILKSIRGNPSFLILDEPTSSLSETESEILFSIVAKLKKQGCGIIYISHRMKEIFQLCDEVSILRNGKHIATKKIDDVDHASIVKMMTGRSLSSAFPEKTNLSRPEKALEIQNISHPPHYKNITFHIYKGEIFGLYGLVGSGRTEIAKGLFGILPNSSGTILIHGKEVQICNPRKAIARSIAFVTENRREEGLVTSANIEENISMVRLESILRRGLINRRLEKDIATRHVDSLKIKTPGTTQIVRHLSGGNQQKVVLAKWFQLQPDIFIFDEPTRGIDVGAKFEVYEIIHKLAREGCSILFISSELPEIMHLCDRIALVKDSQIIHQAPINEISEEDIITKLTI